MRSFFAKYIYSQVMALLGPATRGCAATISTLTDASSSQTRLRAWTSMLGPIRPRLLSSMPVSSPLVLQALHRKCVPLVASPVCGRQYQSLQPAVPQSTRISYGAEDSLAALDPPPPGPQSPAQPPSDPVAPQALEVAVEAQPGGAAATEAAAGASNGTGGASADPAAAGTPAAVAAPAAAVVSTAAPAAAAASTPAAAPGPSSTTSSGKAATGPAAAAAPAPAASSSSSTTTPAASSSSSSQAQPSSPAAPVPSSTPAAKAPAAAAAAAPSTSSPSPSSSSSSDAATTSQAGPQTATAAAAPTPAAAAGPTPPQPPQPTPPATPSSSSGAPAAAAPAAAVAGEEEPTLVITRRGLELVSGAAMLPHPDKAHRGGEDSFFIAEHRAAIGVADGVGGWAEIGVDAGAYARLLMAHAKDAAEASLVQQPERALSAQDILEAAYLRTNVQGSSTACVAVLNGSTLAASNVGDSGFVLVRGAKAAFQSPQQQHNFNFPYQLGSAESMSDQPQSAMRFEMTVQPGDIVVMGSDGLWDNVFAEEVALIASRCAAKGETAETAAQVLCRYARMRASDAKYHSPFSYAAMQAGYVYLGGKMDDVTVLVSYVAQPSKL